MWHAHPLLALAICANRVAATGFIPLNVRSVDQSHSNLARRQQDVNLTKQLAGRAYMIDLAFGTPPQNLTLLLDTGSSNIYVNPDCVSAGDAELVNYCQGLPRFDYTASRTYKDLRNSTNLPYGDGNANINWVSDNIQFKTTGSTSHTVRSQQFGRATKTLYQSSGILGIGPRLKADPYYSYFVDSLVSQGLIASRAFSLNLQSNDSQDSSIIFGGYNLLQFTGVLHKYPIPNAATEGLVEDQYWIKLDAVNITSAAGTTYNVPVGKYVLLDSGTTNTKLPPAIVNQMRTAFDHPTLDGKKQEFPVNCNLRQRTDTVDFVFGTQTIKVAYKDLLRYDNGDCYLGITPSCDPGFDENCGEKAVSILGANFLRSAYVLFDQDNRNIHLAQAADCGSNVIHIGGGTDTISSVTGGCTPPASTATTSTTSGSATQDATVSAATPTKSSGAFVVAPAHDTLVGVAIGVAVALL